MSGAEERAPDPAEACLDRLVQDGLRAHGTGAVEERVLGLWRAAEEANGARRQRRWQRHWLGALVGAAGVAAAAVLLSILFAPASSAASILSLAARAAGEALDRRYAVTIERRGPRFEPGEFQLDLRGESSMRLEGLAGPFEGIVLGRDGATYYAAPPRASAPVFVTGSAATFEDWMRGRQLSGDTLDVGRILGRLSDSDAEFTIRTGTSPGAGIVRVIAEREDGPPSPAPRRVELDVRETDGLLVAMDMRFGLPRPPRAPLRVRFELLSEDPRPDDWYSLDAAAGADRRRVPMSPR